MDDIGEVSLLLLVLHLGLLLGGDLLLALPATLLALGLLALRGSVGLALLSLGGLLCWSGGCQYAEYGSRRRSDLRILALWGVADGALLELLDGIAHGHLHGVDGGGTEVLGRGSPISLWWQMSASTLRQRRRNSSRSVSWSAWHPCGERSDNSPHRRSC